ncbi:nitroreductase family deazaflavin-dependent oxidoreductase [Mycobacterium sp.]|uniref:nitroreductase family deazaflavin-dependent oxidoreductase n=1 Tax=Mycobacterium sp. TaxID=1785 RepID=UPI003A875470
MSRFSLPETAPRGLSSPLTARFIKYAAKAHVGIFKLTRGRVGDNWRIGAGFGKPVPTLLLEHRGRKSGKLFTTPLIFLRTGTDLVIVASQGGLPKNPQWYYNLIADPDARVWLPGGTAFDVSARVAAPDERARLWPELVGLYADFAKYEQWTDREIPVFILSPR